MNSEHCKSIRHYIDSVKDNVSVRLPPEDSLNCQRNGHCHLYGCLIDVFFEDGRKQKKTYRDIPDEYYDDCMEVLEIATKYAEDPNVYHRFESIMKKVREEKLLEGLEQWMES